MVDLAYTHAQAKEVAPLTNLEGGRAEAAMAMPLRGSPPLITDGVDKMYRPLVEIHTIATTQLVKFAYWHWFDSTHSLDQVETSRQRKAATPSTIRLVPLPPSISLPRPCYGSRASASSPRLPTKLARVAWTHHLSATRGVHARVDKVTSSRTRSRSHVAPPPSTPLATRGTCFNVLSEAARRPQASTRRHHLTSLPTTRCRHAFRGP
jgi:hypothetical protein